MRTLSLSETLTKWHSFEALSKSELLYHGALCES